MGKLLGVLYGFFPLIFILFIILGFAVTGPETRAEMVPMIVMLLLYPIMGFIGGIIGAAIYNLAAKITGDIEFELEHQKTGKI